MFEQMRGVPCEKNRPVPQSPAPKYGPFRRSKLRISVQSDPETPYFDVFLARIEIPRARTTSLYGSKIRKLFMPPLPPPDDFIAREPIGVCLSIK